MNLRTKTPWGAFYFFNHSNNSLKSYPIPGTISRKPGAVITYSGSRLIRHKPQDIAKQLQSFFSPISIFIPSTQSPHTSLSIAITDAIGSSKSHRNLMPLLWNLVEANIKRNGQLLLSRWYSLCLAPAASIGLNQSLQHPWAPMASGSSFGVMVIPLAKLLKPFGAAFEAWCQLQKAGVPLTNAITRQPAVMPVVGIGVIKTLPHTSGFGIGVDGS